MDIVVKMNFKTLGYDTMSVELLDDAYQALQASKLEHWFVEYNPPPNKGFTFANEPQLEIINKHMKLMSSHTGFSYGWTMKTLQHELRKRPQMIMEKIIQNAEQSSDPEIREQAKSMKEFQEGKLTYAQMRALCG